MRSKSALIEHPSVEQAVVVAHESPAGEKFLVAYLVSRGEPAPVSAELRAFLRRRMPDFMVPSVFVIMTAFPLTSNGKIDRQALPAPAAPGLVSDLPEPQTGTAFERLLMQIWKEVLGVNQIGLQDNFFDLGGHSLLVFRVMNRIAELFDSDLSLAILFAAPTFADFVDTVLENLAGKENIEQISRLVLELAAAQDVEDQQVSEDRKGIDPAP